jgi:hypothetical protein
MERINRDYWRERFDGRSDLELDLVWNEIQEKIRIASGARLERPYDQRVRQGHNLLIEVCSILWTEMKTRQEAQIDYIDHYEEVA